MACLFPFRSRATEAGSETYSFISEYKSDRFSFQDSVALKRRPPEKAPVPVERPPRETQDDRIRNIDRRSIKQVPRSVPKLKPQPVPEGVKIRRSSPPGM